MAEVEEAPCKYVKTEDYGKNVYRHVESPLKTP